MAILRVSDVIVPEVYARYLTEDSIKNTSLYGSGILVTSQQLNSLLSGGGETFNMPFWQRLSGDLEAIQSDFTLTPAKASTSKMTARRLLFGKAWSAEDLASALSGENAMAAIQSMVDEYWSWQQQRVLFAIIKGVIADNVDNDSSALVHDVTTTGTVAAGNKISSSAVISGHGKLGDAAGAFTAIAMHSVPYYTLVALNLIDFEPTNTQNLGFGTYLGLSVIVTDELTADTDGANSVYWNILFKPGAIGYGESASGIVPVETDRIALDSEDILVTRRQFAMHPLGFKWLETSVSGEMPTRSELEEPGNWDRVYEKKNCGIVVIKTNG